MTRRLVNFIDIEPETMSDSSQTIQLSLEFSDEQLLAICEVAGARVLRTRFANACECPSYLVRLLHEVREFRRYTRECIERFPHDTDTHNWLSSRASQVEMLLSVTILEFLQKEDLIDRHNQLNLNRLAERSRSLIVNQKIAC